ncbi:MAG: hypothetical protein NDJ90_09465 [Oligoflexia bacterium]|nr:hypothetical protein [Oligoflexia bacterium]
MRRNLLALAAFLTTLAVSCTTPPVSSVSPRLLVTSFEPFDGRGVNLSGDVARELAALRGTLPGEPEIELCRLPVVYDLAALKAEECLKRHSSPPLLVLSLGEGGCDLRIETAAVNLDDTPGFADNAGTIRTGAPIVPGAATRLGFTLPVSEMYCSLPVTERGHVVPSISAGRYVCNNTAYRLAHALRTRGIPYGLVHVPHSGCKPAAKDPRRNAGLLATALKPALIALNRAPASALAPAPTSREEVSASLRSLASERSPAEACRRDFLEQLLKRYSK